MKPNRQLRFSHQPGFHRALDLAGDRHAVTYFVFPDKLDPPEKNRRTFHKASGFPERKARFRVEPQLPLEQAYSFLSWCQLKHMDLLALTVRKAPVLKFLVRWRNRQGPLIPLTLCFTCHIARNHAVFDGVIAFEA